MKVITSIKFSQFISYYGNDHSIKNLVIIAVEDINTLGSGRSI